MFVRTERLTLRPGWTEDAPALAVAIGDPRVVTMLSRAPWPYALDDAEQFLSRPDRIDEPNFLIFEHVGSTIELVGGIGVHREGGIRELGYWLHPDAWGRGLMTEAATAVVRTLTASLNVRELSAGHFLDNPASGRVLEKVGFRPTGEVASMPSAARGIDVPCVRYTWHRTIPHLTLAA